MREIKFRVWDGSHMNDATKTNYVDKTGFVDRSESHESNVWLQYIGLKDKNGVEIYEGDILTSNQYPFQVDDEYNYHGIIEWVDELAAFYLTKRLVNRDKVGISDGISEQIENIELFEVIGNIYSNPELLNR